MSRIPSLYKLIAVFTALCLEWTSITMPTAYAESSAQPLSSLRTLDSQTLKLPDKFGEIVESFSGDKNIIIIQDAHAIPDAQKNITNIIRFIEKQYGVDTVALEGASGDLDPQIFKSFPDQKLLRDVMKEYMNAGEIAGGTAAAIFDETDAKYEGVEDWDVYEEGLGLYLSAMEKEAELTENLNALREELGAEKQRVYSKALWEIDQQVESFYENSNQLAHVIKVLAEVKAPQTGSELEVLWKELKKNPSEADMINGKDIEVRQIAKKLEKNLTSPEEVKRFNARKQAWMTGELSAEAFAVELKEIAEETGTLISMSEELHGMVKDQQTLKGLEGTKLFRDLEVYIRQVKELLMENSFRELDRRTEALRIITKLTKLELSREEWKKLSSGEIFEDFKILGLEDRDYVYQLAFYLNAEERDEVFFKHLKELKGNSVIVAGGFHAEGLTSRLKEAGIGYALVMPKIKHIPEAISYREQMRGDVSWKDYFEVENGRIYLYKAFVRAVRDKLLGIGKDANVLMLKAWRDQIVRDLADEGKIERAGWYTRYMDEVADESLKHTDTDTLLSKVDSFIRGLRGLEKANQLNSEQITALLRANMAQVPTAPLASPATSISAPLLRKAPFSDMFDRAKQIWEQFTARLMERRVTSSPAEIFVTSRAEVRLELEEKLTQIVEELNAAIQDQFKPRGRVLNSVAELQDIEPALVDPFNALAGALQIKSVEKANDSFRARLAELLQSDLARINEILTGLESSGERLQLEYDLDKGLLGLMRSEARDGEDFNPYEAPQSDLSADSLKERLETQILSKTGKKVTVKLIETQTIAGRFFLSLFIPGLLTLVWSVQDYILLFRMAFSSNKEMYKQIYLNGSHYSGKRFFAMIFRSIPLIKSKALSVEEDLIEVYAPWVYESKLQDVEGFLIEIVPRSEVRDTGTTNRSESRLIKTLTFLIVIAAAFFYFSDWGRKTVQNFVKSKNIPVLRDIIRDRGGEETGERDGDVRFRSGEVNPEGVELIKKIESTIYAPNHKLGDPDPTTTLTLDDAKNLITSGVKNGTIKNLSNPDFFRNITGEALRDFLLDPNSNKKDFGIIKFHLTQGINQLNEENDRKRKADSTYRKGASTKLQPAKSAKRGELESAESPEGAEIQPADSAEGAELQPAKGTEGADGLHRQPPRSEMREQRELISQMVDPLVSGFSGSKGWTTVEKLFGVYRLKLQGQAATLVEQIYDIPDLSMRFGLVQVLREWGRELSGKAVVSLAEEIILTAADRVERGQIPDAGRRKLLKGITASTVSLALPGSATQLAQGPLTGSQNAVLVTVEDLLGETHETVINGSGFFMQSSRSMVPGSDRNRPEFEVVGRYLHGSRERELLRQLESQGIGLEQTVSALTAQQRELIEKTIIRYGAEFERNLDYISIFPPRIQELILNYQHPSATRLLDFVSSGNRTMIRAYRQELSVRAQALREKLTEKIRESEPDLRERLEEELQAAQLHLRTERTAVEWMTGVVSYLEKILASSDLPTAETDRRIDTARKNQPASFFDWQVPRGSTKAPRSLDYLDPSVEIADLELMLNWIDEHEPLIISPLSPLKGGNRWENESSNRSEVRYAKWARVLYLTGLLLAVVGLLTTAGGAVWALGVGVEIAKIFTTSVAVQVIGGVLMGAATNMPELFTAIADARNEYNKKISQSQDESEDNDDEEGITLSNVTVPSYVEYFSLEEREKMNKVVRFFQLFSAGMAIPIIILFFPSIGLLTMIGAEAWLSSLMAIVAAGVVSLKAAVIGLLATIGAGSWLSPFIALVAAGLTSFSAGIALIIAAVTAIIIFIASAVLLNVAADKVTAYVQGWDPIIRKLFRAVSTSVPEGASTSTMLASGMLPAAMTNIAMSIILNPVITAVTRIYIRYLAYRNVILNKQAEALQHKAEVSRNVYSNEQWLGAVILGLSTAAYVAFAGIAVAAGLGIAISPALIAVSAAALMLVGLVLPTILPFINIRERENIPNQGANDGVVGQSTFSNIYNVGFIGFGLIVALGFNTPLLGVALPVFLMMFIVMAINNFIQGFALFLIPLLGGLESEKHRKKVIFIELMQSRLVEYTTVILGVSFLVLNGLQMAGVAILGTTLLSVAIPVGIFLVTAVIFSIRAFSQAQKGVLPQAEDISKDLTRVEIWSAGALLVTGTLAVVIAVMFLSGTIMSATLIVGAILAGTSLAIFFGNSIMELIKEKAQKVAAKIQREGDLLLSEDTDLPADGAVARSEARMDASVKLIVVDDLPLQRKIITSFLEKIKNGENPVFDLSAKGNVLEATNGSIGLSTIFAALTDDSLQTVLVVLDNDMPGGISGAEVIGALTKMAQDQEIDPSRLSIIFRSSKVEEGLNETIRQVIDSAKESGIEVLATGKQNNAELLELGLAALEKHGHLTRSETRAPFSIKRIGERFISNYQSMTKSDRTRIVLEGLTFTSVVAFFSVILSLSTSLIIWSSAALFLFLIIKSILNFQPDANDNAGRLIPRREVLVSSAIATFPLALGIRTGELVYEATIGSTPQALISEQFRKIYHALRNDPARLEKLTYEDIRGYAFAIMKGATFLEFDGESTNGLYVYKDQFGLPNTLLEYRLLLDDLKKLPSSPAPAAEARNAVERAFIRDRITNFTMPFAEAYSFEEFVRLLNAQSPVDFRVTNQNSDPLTQGALFRHPIDLLKFLAAPDLKNPAYQEMLKQMIYEEKMLEFLNLLNRANMYIESEIAGDKVNFRFPKELFLYTFVLDATGVSSDKSLSVGTPDQRLIELIDFMRDFSARISNSGTVDENRKALQEARDFAQKRGFTIYLGDFPSQSSEPDFIKLPVPSFYIQDPMETAPSLDRSEMRVSPLLAAMAAAPLLSLVTNAAIPSSSASKAPSAVSRDQIVAAGDAIDIKLPLDVVKQIQNLEKQLLNDNQAENFSGSKFEELDAGLQKLLGLIENFQPVDFWKRADDLEAEGFDEIIYSLLSAAQSGEISQGEAFLQTVHELSRFSDPAQQLWAAVLLTEAQKSGGKKADSKILFAALSRYHRGVGADLLSGLARNLSKTVKLLDKEELLSDLAQDGQGNGLIDEFYVRLLIRSHQVLEADHFARQDIEFLINEILKVVINRLAVEGSERGITGKSTRYSAIAVSILIEFQKRDGESLEEILERAEEKLKQIEKEGIIIDDKLWPYLNRFIEEEVSSVRSELRVFEEAFSAAALPEIINEIHEQFMLYPKDLLSRSDMWDEMDRLKIYDEKLHGFDRANYEFDPEIKRWYSKVISPGHNRKLILGSWQDIRMADGQPIVTMPDDVVIRFKDRDGSPVSFYSFTQYSIWGDIQNGINLSQVYKQELVQRGDLAETVSPGAEIKIVDTDDSETLNEDIPSVEPKLIHVNTGWNLGSALLRVQERGGIDVSLNQFQDRGRMDVSLEQLQENFRLMKRLAIGRHKSPSAYFSDMSYDFRPDDPYQPVGVSEHVLRGHVHLAQMHALLFPLLFLAGTDELSEDKLEEVIDRAFYEYGLAAQKRGFFRPEISIELTEPVQLSVGSQMELPPSDILLEIDTRSDATIESLIALSRYAYSFIAPKEEYFHSFNVPEEEYAFSDQGAMARLREGPVTLRISSETEGVISQAWLTLPQLAPGKRGEVLVIRLDAQLDSDPNPFSGLNSALAPDQEGMFFSLPVYFLELQGEGFTITPKDVKGIDGSNRPEARDPRELEEQGLAAARERVDRGEDAARQEFTVWGSMDRPASMSVVTRHTGMRFSRKNPPISREQMLEELSQGRIGYVNGMYHYIRARSETRSADTVDSQLNNLEWFADLFNRYGLKEDYNALRERWKNKATRDEFAREALRFAIEAKRSIPAYQDLIQKQGGKISPIELLKNMNLSPSMVALGIKDKILWDNDLFANQAAVALSQFETLKRYNQSQLVYVDHFSFLRQMLKNFSIYLGLLHINEAIDEAQGDAVKLDSLADRFTVTLPVIRPEVRQDEDGLEREVERGGYQAPWERWGPFEGRRFEATLQNILLPFQSINGVANVQARQEAIAILRSLIYPEQDEHFFFEILEDPNVYFVPIERAKAVREEQGARMPEGVPFPDFMFVRVSEDGKSAEIIPFDSKRTVKGGVQGERQILADRYLKLFGEGTEISLQSELHSDGLREYQSFSVPMQSSFLANPYLAEIFAPLGDAVNRIETVAMRDGAQLVTYRPSSFDENNERNRLGFTQSNALRFVVPNLEQLGFFQSYHEGDWNQSDLRSEARALSKRAFLTRVAAVGSLSVIEGLAQIFGQENVGRLAQGQELPYSGLNEAERDLIVSTLSEIEKMVRSNNLDLRQFAGNRQELLEIIGVFLDEKTRQSQVVAVEGLTHGFKQGSGFVRTDESGEPKLGLDLGMMAWALSEPAGGAGRLIFRDTLLHELVHFLHFKQGIGLKRQPSREERETVLETAVYANHTLYEIPRSNSEKAGDRLTDSVRSPIGIYVIRDSTGDPQLFKNETTGQMQPYTLVNANPSLAERDQPFIDRAELQVLRGIVNTIKNPAVREAVDLRITELAQKTQGVQDLQVVDFSRSESRLNQILVLVEDEVGRDNLAKLLDYIDKINRNPNVRYQLNLDDILTLALDIFVTLRKELNFEKNIQDRYPDFDIKELKFDLIRGAVSFYDPDALFGVSADGALGVTRSTVDYRKVLPLESLFALRSSIYIISNKKHPIFTPNKLFDDEAPESLAGIFNGAIYFALKDQIAAREASSEVMNVEHIEAVASLFRNLSIRMTPENAKYRIISELIKLEGDEWLNLQQEMTELKNRQAKYGSFEAEELGFEVAAAVEARLPDIKRILDFEFQKIFSALKVADTEVSFYDMLSEFRKKSISGRKMQSIAAQYTWINGQGVFPQFLNSATADRIKKWLKDEVGVSEADLEDIYNILTTIYYGPTGDARDFGAASAILRLVEIYLPPASPEEISAESNGETSEVDRISKNVGRYINQWLSGQAGLHWDSGWATAKYHSITDEESANRQFVDEVGRQIVSAVEQRSFSDLIVALERILTRRWQPMNVSISSNVRSESSELFNSGVSLGLDSLDATTVNWDVLRKIAFRDQDVAGVLENSAIFKPVRSELRLVAVAAAEKNVEDILDLLGRVADHDPAQVADETVMVVVELEVSIDVFDQKMHEALQRRIARMSGSEDLTKALLQVNSMLSRFTKNPAAGQTNTAGNQKVKLGFVLPVKKDQVNGEVDQFIRDFKNLLAEVGVDTIESIAINRDAALGRDVRDQLGVSIQSLESALDTSDEKIATLILSVKAQIFKNLLGVEIEDSDLGDGDTVYRDMARLLAMRITFFSAQYLAGNPSASNQEMLDYVTAALREAGFDTEIVVLKNGRFSVLASALKQVVQTLQSQQAAAIAA